MVPSIIERCVRVVAVAMGVDMILSFRQEAASRLRRANWRDEQKTVATDDLFPTAEVIFRCEARIHSAALSRRADEMLRPSPRNGYRVIPSPFFRASRAIWKCRASPMKE